MLLSPSTFLSSLPNSLPKEKGTSNASLCPPSSALTDLTTDVSGLDHRGRGEKKKLDLQTHCLWHFETTRGKDTSEMEWSAFCQPSLVSVMRSTRQNREAAAGSALEQLQGFSKGKGGKRLMEPPKCKYNSLQPFPPLYSDLYGFSALGMLVNDRQVSLVRHVELNHIL